MTAVSIDIAQSWGLTWFHWKRLVAVVEKLGFAGLYCSDHFVAGPEPANASLEPMMCLSYLASHTQQVHFGPLVTPVSFRDPVMLACQALALDDLSGGRMVLGLGAGWQHREYTMFGYELGDMPTRFARLGEALEVVTRLLRSDTPVSFEGQFYQLQDAVLLPRPQHPGGPPIWRCWSAHGCGWEAQSAPSATVPDRASGWLGRGVCQVRAGAVRDRRIGDIY
jgi:alkanesulfonate monooxygenase SsuD/methylene tetrahydromethanopterin reductase-like flavin-dependent oxidoreductase (luciferase family)